MGDLIRWQEAPAGILAGYAGGNAACLFEIHPPDERDAEWILQPWLPGYIARHGYGSSPDALKDRAEELLGEFAASIGAVFPAPVTPLTADGTRCDWEILNEDEEPVQCPAESRYMVIRSDRDPSYDVTCDRAATEACGRHLAETACRLMDGNDRISAVVQVRWDA